MTDLRFASRMCIAILIAFLTGIPSLAVGQDEADGLAEALVLQQRFVRVIEQSEPSVVGIGRLNLTEPLVKEAGEFVPNDFGSGVIFAPEHDPTQRLVLTNLHVVKGGPVVGSALGGSALEIYLFNHRRARARILAADPRSDLAVLQLDLTDAGLATADLKPIRIGNADDAKKGQFVLALGNPYALARDGSPSASWGIISNIARKPALPPGSESQEEFQKQHTIHHLGTLLQIDARLNLGTSGGALVNLNGELVGITTSMAALDGYEKSAGFAVPMDSATHRVVDSLARGFEVEYGFLGVGPEDVPPVGLPPGMSRPSAVRVKVVLANSPARLAGIHNQDFILSVNSRPIFSSHDLMREIGKLGPGTPVRLQVLRWPLRNELSMEVVLGKWPVYNDEDIIATNSRFPPWRGIAVDYPTARWKYYDSEANRYPNAVLVTQIDGGPDAASRLRAGDLITHVDGSPVETPAQFYKTVRDHAAAVELRLADGRTITIPPGK